MNSSVLAISVVAVLLSACASTVSVADLRTVNEGSSVLNIPMTYESAYRIIAGESRRCFERNFSAGTVNVRADLYGESKTGEISIAGALMTSSVAEVLIEIRAVDAKTTEIKTFYRKKSSESVERAMRAWLGGNNTICHVE
jgi:hypothetical protein